MFCNDINPRLLEVQTCHVKPTRQGNGLTTVWVFAKEPYDEIWFAMNFFYKYGLIFRKWILNWDKDWCQATSKSIPTDPFFSFFVQIFKQLAPEMVHECPYDGFFGVKNLDFAALVEESLPQLIPRGTYKILSRFYKKSTNETYMNLWFVAEIKALDREKEIFMG